MYKILVFLFQSSSQKRKRYNPDPIGDLSPSHFNTPRKAKKEFRNGKI